MFVRIPLACMTAFLVIASGTFGQEENDPTKLLRQAGEKARARDFDGAVELFRQAYELDPANQQAALGLLGTLQTRGIQVARSDRKAANAYLYEAGKIAGAMLKANKDVPNGVRRILATAVYNEACCYAVDAKFEKALASLERAFAAGFEDFDQIAKDEDLVELRKQEGFEPLIARAREIYRQRLVASVKKEMAEQEPFEFQFSLPSVDRETVASAHFKGRVLIADIWGTWCPPCRAEIPHFVKLVKKYGDQDLRIVGLNYESGNDDEAKVKKIKDFMEEYKMNYPCLLGDDQTKDQVPGFRGYPTTVFLDRNGKVRLTLVGLQPYEKLETAVKLLLEE